MFKLAGWSVVKKVPLEFCVIVPFKLLKPKLEYEPGNKNFSVIPASNLCLSFSYTFLATENPISP